MHNSWQGNTYNVVNSVAMIQTFVMGVNSQDHIYLMTQISIGKEHGLSHGWRRIEGLLKQISCSPGNSSNFTVKNDHTALLDHAAIWGVNGGDQIYFKNNPDDPHWQNVEGALKQVEVSEMGWC